jgi:hypothetical protein
MDIKPHNIISTEKEGFNRVYKLIDLNISKLNKD